jgi:hypothetical protein
MKTEMKVGGFHNLNRCKTVNRASWEVYQAALDAHYDVHGWQVNESVMDQNKRCVYRTPVPFRRQISRCPRKAVEGAKYCRQHLCPCGIGPFTHRHNEVLK